MDDIENEPGYAEFKKKALAALENLEKRGFIVREGDGFRLTEYGRKNIQQLKDLGLVPPSGPKPS